MMRKITAALAARHVGDLNAQIAALNADLAETIRERNAFEDALNEITEEAREIERLRMAADEQVERWWTRSDFKLGVIEGGRAA